MNENGESSSDKIRSNKQQIDLSHINEYNKHLNVKAYYEARYKSSKSKLL